MLLLAQPARSPATRVQRQCLPRHRRSCPSALAGSTVCAGTPENYRFRIRALIRSSALAAQSESVLLRQHSRSSARAAGGFPKAGSWQRQTGPACGRPSHSAWRYAASWSGAANLRGTARSLARSLCLGSSRGTICVVNTLVHCQVRPNTSFKPSPNGGPPGPVWRYAVHFRQPGPGVPPSVPA